MKKLLFILLALTLSSCATTPNQNLYTVACGLGGGLLGSQFGKSDKRLLFIGAGTLTGALLGGGIGLWMDQVDHISSNNETNY